MAKQTKSSVFAIKEETSEGTLIQPSASTDFMNLRDGFSFESSVETVDSDELVNDIGASKGFLAKETPSGSIPKYFKHSGVEGQAPDYGLMIKSAMGSEYINLTEYDVVSGSTAGSSSAAATLQVDAGEGANFRKGQAVLIKDGTNGYAIRNIKSISGDTLTLNYNLSGDPAAGVNLGKAIHYAPEATGHVTYSAHLWQASSGSAYQQSMAGCRTTSMSIEFPANELATINFDFEGIKFFMNPVEITAANKHLDFATNDGTLVATLDEKTYKTPMEFARAVALKLNAVNTDGTISVEWDNSTGKYTVSSDGLLLQIEAGTGANVATGAWGVLGFDAINVTGSLSYTSDNEANYDPAVTPAADSSDPNIVRGNELMIGGFTANTCRNASNVSFSVSTPKTDVNSLCAESGVSESIVLQREATMSATLLLNKHDVKEFDTFLNNGSTSVMFNHGPKSGGSWVAGKCVNVYMENASLTSHVIADSDGYQVINVEAKGYVTTTGKDINLNLV